MRIAKSRKRKRKITENTLGNFENLFGTPEKAS